MLRRGSKITSGTLFLFVTANSLSLSTHASYNNLPVKYIQIRNKIGPITGIKIKTIPSTKVPIDLITLLNISDSKSPIVNTVLPSIKHYLF